MFLSKKLTNKTICLQIIYSVSIQVGVTTIIIDCKNIAWQVYNIWKRVVKGLRQGGVVLISREFSRFILFFVFIAPDNFHQTAKAFSQRTLAAKIRWLIDTSLVVCQLYTDKKLFFIPTGHTFTAKVLRHWARFCFYFRFYYYPPPPPSSSLSYCFLKQSPAGKKSQHLLWYMSQT